MLQPAPRRRVILPCAMLACAVLGGVCAGPAAAAFPGRDGLIAYTRTDALGNQTVWSVRPGSGREQRVTEVPARCRKLRRSWFDDVPAFSRSGRYLYYSHSGDCDRRMPDGLYRIRVGGTSPELVLRDSGALVTWWPVPAPGGGRLLFVNDIPISPRTDPDEFADTIHSASLRRRGRTRRLSPRGATSDELPGISASGRIVFARDRHSLMVGPASGRLARGGGRLRLLTSFRKGAFASSDWAPGERRVVFERQRRGKGFHSDVFVIGARGRGLRRITRSDDAVSPVFSPSGRRIAYARTPEDADPTKGPLYVTDRRGRRKRKLLSEIDVTRLSWQPLPRGGR